MKIQIVAAALSLVVSLGLVGAGCRFSSAAPEWPLTCQHESGETACAVCVRTSCCSEATACGNDTGCECVIRCRERASEQPMRVVDPSLECMRTCQIRNSRPAVTKPFIACVSAHCADLCAAPAGDADAGTPKGTPTP